MSRLLKPNTAQIPNILFDAVMARVSPAQFKVLMAVARKTYGWGKDRDRISLSQIEGLTGLSRRGVIDAVRDLAWILITVKGGPSDVGSTYEINENAALEVVNSVHHGASELSSPAGEASSPEVVNSVHLSGELSSPEVVNSVHIQNPIKPTIQNPKKEESPPAADGFDDLGLGGKHPARIVGVELWQRLESEWRSKRKWLGLHSLEENGLFLLDAKVKGQDPVQIVRKALRGGWSNLRLLAPDEVSKPEVNEDESAAAARREKIRALAKGGPNGQGNIRRSLDGVGEVQRSKSNGRDARSLVA